MHGIEYNNMSVESVHKSILAGILLVRLFETDLNNDEGLDFFLQKIQEIVGIETLGFIKDRLQFKVNKPISESNEDIKSKVNIQFEIRDQVKSLINTIREGYKQNISKDTIDNLLIEAIIANIA
jgi:hypothetical protein